MNDLEKLYSQYATAVFRFSWGLCGDRSTAEDLVSETFVRIMTKAPKIETSTGAGLPVYLPGLLCHNPGGPPKRRRHSKREKPCYVNRS